MAAPLARTLAVPALARTLAVPALARILAIPALALAAPLAAALPAGAAMAQPAAKPATPHLMDAWVRMPAASGRPAGGYFLAHGTTEADTLVGVTSPKAARIEMHSMANENGVMKMRAEPGFALPAGGELKFAPGGNHLMLFDLAPDVKAGDRIPLTFSFKSGARVTVDAEARAAAAPASQPEPAHRH